MPTTQSRYQKLRKFKSLKSQDHYRELFRRCVTDETIALATKPFFA
jgi:hypothetical protein